MDKTDELIEALDKNLIKYKEYTPTWGKCKDMAGLAFLHPNKQETFISYAALAATPIEKILAYIANPANVKQMTRIVGYFSYTSGWNKGKLGELGDRKRITNDSGA